MNSQNKAMIAWLVIALAAAAVVIVPARNTWSEPVPASAAVPAPSEHAQTPPEGGPKPIARPTAPPPTAAKPVAPDRAPTQPLRREPPGSELEAGLMSAASATDHEKRRAILRGMGITLSDEAFAGAAAGNVDRWTLLRAVAGQWMTVDPNAAANWLADNVAEQPAHPRLHDAFVLSFRDWAAADPAAAAAWSRNIQNVHVSAKVIPYAAAAFGAHDPRAAAEWVRELPDDSPALRSAVQTVSTRLLQVDPHAVGELAARLPDEERAAVLKILAIRMSGDNLDRAAEWAESFPEGPDRQTVMAVIGRRLVGHNDEGALEIAKRLPAEAGEEIIGSVAGSMAGTDIEGAIALVNALPENSLGRGAAAMALAPALAVNGRPREALEWTELVVDDMARRDAVERTVMAWAESQPAEAAEWVMGLDDMDKRRRLLASVSYVWSAADAPAIEAWAAKLRNNEEKDIVNAALVEALVGTEPERARALAESLAEGVDRRRALEVIAVEWGRREQAAAAAWLERLPEGPSKDSAVEAFSRLVKRDEP